MILKYRKQIVLTFFFVVYIALLVKLILLKGSVDVRDISLIPFKSTYEYFTDPGATFGLATWNVLGNILIFIPLGLYLRMFKKLKWKQYLVTIALVSLFFEILQFIFVVGHSDIDDIIFNTIGGMFGAFMFVMMTRIFRSEERAKSAVIVLGIVLSVIFLFIMNRLVIRL